jgi:hypothetical protein
MARVSLNDLLDALEYVSSVVTVEACAYVSRDTGSVYFVGTDMEPEESASENLESSDRYVAVPSKQELDLFPPESLWPVQGTARGAGSVGGVVRV